VQHSKATIVDQFGSIITSPEQHAQVLHHTGRGNVVVAQRDEGRWRELSVAIGDLGYVTRSLAGRADAYLSQNRFFGRRRTITTLHELGALFTDLDYYNTPFAGLTPGHLLHHLVLEALAAAKIPTPSFAVSTGRGLALVWLHTAVPRHALPRWRACQRRIFETLGAYGADPRATDAARVLRLIGTQNSRAGTFVEALTGVGAVWDFDDLANEILPLSRAALTALRMRRATDKRFAVAPPANFTAATLWEGRLTDLQKLLQGRWLGELPPGERDAWLFIAGTAMSYLAPVQVLRREIVTLAHQVGGWAESETRSRLSAVLARAEQAARGEKIEYRGLLIDPRYRFKDQTAVEWLHIRGEEMRAFDLRHFVSPEIKRERDRLRKEEERRAAGVISRQQYEATSLSHLKPWETEGISRATWYRKRPNTAETSVSGCMVAKPALLAEGSLSEPPTENQPTPASPRRTIAPLSPNQLPHARQLDLFEKELRLSSLDSWEGGVAPPEIRTRTHELMRQWGLKQGQAAARIGRSQPQLSNILGGWFGASPGTAAALKKLLTELMDAA
jgi:hypothetical protein